jgi:hypothetical protein
MGNIEYFLGGWWELYCTRKIETALEIKKCSPKTIRSLYFEACEKNAVGISKNREKLFVSECAKLSPKETSCFF